MQTTRIIRFSLFAFLLSGGCLIAAEPGAPPAAEVERLGLDPFYAKHLSYSGFPIVASAKVSDYALKEAAFLIDQMIGRRQDIVDALVENKIRLAIMAPDEFTTVIPEHSTLSPPAYWDKRARGLGASKERPAVSVGEENLLGYRGDPYGTESIFVHEFAHAIHLMGLNSIDDTFQARLEKAFNRATLAGLWIGKYAGTNSSEYWAEGVQSWFDTNREDDHDHNHVNTRRELIEHDPALAALVEAVFGDGDWRYVRPDKREDAAHLAGFDREDAPGFSWPEEVIANYEAHERGDHLEKVASRSMDELSRKAKTEGGGQSIQLRIENETGGRISVFWIGFDGKRRHYSTIDPGRNETQQTYGGHLWVVTDEDGSDHVWFSAPDADGLAVIR